MNYTSTTIASRWHPIYDILQFNNIPISEEIITLYHFIKEQARPRVDKKLPVSHVLLNQQISALDLFFTGYKLILAKAVMVTAWAAQLRVSEYSSPLVADVRAGEDHNLQRDHVLVQPDGLTVIFMSDKTSLHRKERFIAWDNLPITNCKEILAKYNSVRNMSSPVFFCHEDGTNITPNDMSNWIDISTSHTDWHGLKFTSHCYRIGGTSYLYRTGMDIPNVQRSGRWSHTDTTAVEHYLKPGLYSATPASIRESLPQYKLSLTISQAIYLRDKITTLGGPDHPFNSTLRGWGFPSLRRSAYPTHRAVSTLKAKLHAATAFRFMQTIQQKRADTQTTRLRRAQKAARHRRTRVAWRKKISPHYYGSFTDITRSPQCSSCTAYQCRSMTSAAKIQALSAEITNRKYLSAQLQEARLKIANLEVEQKELSSTILKHERTIRAHKSFIHELKLASQVLRRENACLKRRVGRSLGKMHKQTRTAHAGEDITAEGHTLYPSPHIMSALIQQREQIRTQKFVDIMGEARLTPLIKLRTNMYTAIRRRLSKRFRIRRIYTQGKGAKVDWITAPKNQRITRSMRAKCLSTLYNCCKYGVLHWPDTDNELDPEDTDDELLENLYEAGHSDNPEHYAHVMPDPVTWEPFMAQLKKRPRQVQSTVFRVQMDYTSQWRCASPASKMEAIKTARNDQDKLLHLLRALGLIPESRVAAVSQEELDDLLSTLRTSNNPPASTRASKKHKRKWVLLPDLAAGANKSRQGQCRKTIINVRAEQQRIKATNATKEWVVAEEDDYLCHSH